MSISTILLLCSLPAYLWVAVSVAREIFQSVSVDPKTILWVGTLGSALHIAGALLQMHSPAGTDFSLVRSLSLIMAVTTLLTTLGSARLPTRPLLLVAVPLAILLIGAGALTSQTATPLQLSLGEVAHIILSILAFGILSIATAEAFLLNFVSGRLKEHRLNSALRHIPPVEALETLMFDLLRAGTLLLLLAVISGLVFLQSFAEQHLYHKFFFSVLGLILYAGLWWGHQRFGWRGRSALRWVIGGYICLLLAYAGSKIVLEWILG